MNLRTVTLAEHTVDGGQHNGACNIRGVNQDTAPQDIRQQTESTAWHGTLVAHHLRQRVGHMGRSRILVRALQ